MEAFPDDFPRGTEWSVQEAESLIASLTGVLSARIVTGASGEIDEVHVLTTQEASPKQTVRNVESALRAHFDVRIDHRKISVAQTSREDRHSPLEVPDPSPEPGYADPSQEPGYPDSPPREEPGRGSAGLAEPNGGPVDTGPRDQAMPLFVERKAAGAEGRIIFLGYRSHGDETHPHRVRVTVALEWAGKRFTGEAAAALLPKSRLEALASATLRALEQTMELATDETDAEGAALVLDGVKPLTAFDRQFVLVSVHGLSGPEVTPLAGTAPVHETQDHAAILATLQATDRWVRGKL